MVRPHSTSWHGTGRGSTGTHTLICFSHLRWNFVFQRPQHLMSRFAREMTVIYWEEPVDIPAKETAYLQVREAQDARESFFGQERRL